MREDSFVVGDRVIASISNSGAGVIEQLHPPTRAGGQRGAVVHLDRSGVRLHVSVGFLRPEPAAAPVVAQPSLFEVRST